MYEPPLRPPEPAEFFRVTVSVEVLVPGPHADKRLVQVASEASFRELLDAGVRICTFQPSMLHAKVLTADGEIGCVLVPGGPPALAAFLQEDLLVHEPDIARAP